MYYMNYHGWYFIMLHDLIMLNREKFLRLTMGFGYFMYSHSLVPVIDPWGSGRDKVGIRALMLIVDLWAIVLCFPSTTAVLGYVRSVIIASRIPRYV